MHQPPDLSLLVNAGFHVRLSIFKTVGYLCDVWEIFFWVWISTRALIKISNKCNPVRGGEIKFLQMVWYSSCLFSSQNLYHNPLHIIFDSLLFASRWKYANCRRPQIGVAANKNGRCDDRVLIPTIMREGYVRVSVRLFCRVSQGLRLLCDGQSSAGLKWNLKLRSFVKINRVLSVWTGLEVLHGSS